LNVVRKKPRRRRIKKTAKAVGPRPVTAAELRRLKREIDRRMGGTRRSSARGAPMRWNPNPEDVQKSVAQLVLTLVEFLRRLMERQAIRRMEQKTLTKAEVEAVGTALMKLEATIRDIAAKFDLTPEDLNLDLGPVGKLM
jgi:hypothetical protein